MYFKFLYLFFFIFFISCGDKSKKINYSNNFINYTNKGFTLVYNENLYKKKFINKRINNRSLLIFNNSLKKETPVRITNLINGKYLIAKVGNRINYPNFYNSLISNRIAEELEISLEEPYIEIKTLNHSDTFVAGKAKTFEEEKKVALKVPVEGIVIENISINVKKNKKNLKQSNSNIDFKYIIKIADMYFEESAIILKDRLQNDYNIKGIKINKVSKNTYRIFLGPFKNIDSIKSDYNDIIKLNFENIEIIKL
tara:strand:+ start:1992 stop:2753 length:762 start_codon:yes stop_codon:yes gene_type:complete